MSSIIYLAVLFAAKVADNALSTTKTIMLQRSRWILAGFAVILSDFIYFWITKRVVSAESELAMLVVAIAGVSAALLPVLSMRSCQKTEPMSM